MEFQQVVERRRMIRNYSDEPVDPEAIELILSNALHAPSAGFSQGWAFLVLDQPADLARFWQTTTAPGELPDSWLSGVSKAPVLIVTLSCKRVYLERYAESDKGWTDQDEARWPAPYWDIDTGMAALLMLQTAVDLGLGGLFFGMAPDKIAPFRAAFDIPDDYSPIGVVSVGHRVPDERSPSLKRGRKPVDDVVHRGRW